MRRDIRELDHVATALSPSTYRRTQECPGRWMVAADKPGGERGLRTKPTLQALDLGFLSLQTGREVSVV